MTELHDLTASMLAILENDGQLAKKIGEASIRIVAGIIEEDDRFSMQQLQQYASFFCVGAAWALSSNSTENEGIKIINQK